MAENILDSIKIKEGNLFVRVIPLLVIGSIIAGGLTYFMHVLIETSQQELDQSNRANLLDFVRVKRDETSIKKEPKPQRPETSDAPPAPPAPAADNTDFSDTNLSVALPSVNNNVSVDVGGIGIGTGDGEYLPIVKIAPNYPIEAMKKGLQGSCTVQYTVTTTGATKDIAIVDGECPQVFARASIRAAKKFKYKPRQEDGKTIEVPNVRNMFIFELDNPEP